ncbi:hypothetical protein [Sediminivirga luteola]|nr:hypothetical protein [Sediminivirga luteola]MCI2265933.1 hypothetical protein [Sediminivirga luteola]
MSTAAPLAQRRARTGTVHAAGTVTAVSGTSTTLLAGQAGVSAGRFR